MLNADIPCPRCGKIEFLDASEERMERGNKVFFCTKCRSRYIVFWEKHLSVDVRAIKGEPAC